MTWSMRLKTWLIWSRLRTGLSLILFLVTPWVVRLLCNLRRAVLVDIMVIMPSSPNRTAVGIGFGSRRSESYTQKWGCRESIEDVAGSTLINSVSEVACESFLIEPGFSKSLSEWIGTNLKKDGDHETWAFNLDSAVEMFNSYREKSYVPLLEHPPKDMEIAVVRVENSDRWDPDVLQQLENFDRWEQNGSEGKVSLHVFPGSGHGFTWIILKGFSRLWHPKFHPFQFRSIIYLPLKMYCM